MVLKRPAPGRPGAGPLSKEGSSPGNKTCSNPPVKPRGIVYLLNTIMQYYNYDIILSMMPTMPQCTGDWSPFAGRRPALGHGVPPGCRPALACTGARSAGRRPALEHGVPGRRPAVACTGARSAGRTPALGHGVPGRRPALRSPFGHCLHAGSHPPRTEPLASTERVWAPVWPSSHASAAPRRQHPPVAPSRSCPPGANSWLQVCSPSPHAT